MRKPNFTNVKPANAPATPKKNPVTGELDFADNFIM